jgi:hypothetical protein
MNELRWNLGYGYLRLRIPPEDTIKILVLTRGSGQGFYYKEGNPIIWAKTLVGSDPCKKLLQKSGYCDPKQL